MIVSPGPKVVCEYVFDTSQLWNCSRHARRGGGGACVFRTLTIAFFFRTTVRGCARFDVLVNSVNCHRFRRKCFQFRWQYVSFTNAVTRYVFSCCVTFSMRHWNFSRLFFWSTRIRYDRVLCSERRTLGYLKIYWRLRRLAISRTKFRTLRFRRVFPKERTVLADFIKINVKGGDHRRLAINTKIPKSPSDFVLQIVLNGWGSVNLSLPKNPVKSCPSSWILVKVRNRIFRIPEAKPICFFFLRTNYCTCVNTSFWNRNVVPLRK